jgi:hypothetical protein
MASVVSVASEFGAGAQTMLAAIQPTTRETETLEARFIAPDGQPPIRRFYRSREALLADVARLAPARHVYVGLALRSGQDGTAAGVSRAGAAWAEVDAKLWVGAADPKAAALGVIRAFPAPPGVVVDTWGGYHTYWPLPEPLNVQAAGARARLELVNAGLARAVCGPERTPDRVHDVARVLRLVGTLNHKPEYGVPRPVVLVECRPERRYTLDQLHGLLAERYPWALRPAVTGRVPAPAPGVFGLLHDVPSGDLRERAACGRIRRATLALLDSTGAAGYQSASEADAAIAAALIGAGLTESEAFSLLTLSARGRDAVERKGSRHAEAYWRRTVTRAADYVGPVLETDAGRRVRRLRPVQRPRGVPLVRPGGRA